jgi:Leucine-rich repeat (LRR) protein
MKLNQLRIKRVIYLISIIIFLFYLPIFVHGAIPVAERAALIALYNSTNGDNWINNTGWKTPPLHTDGFAMPGTENTWYGVTCDPGNTAVINIDLYSNNLIGPIPKELGNLSDLKYLTLDDNQLTGDIPSELGNMVMLESLSLDSNQLTGNIPSELGNLSFLETLSLVNNQLTGTIPPELGNLLSLRILYLYLNQLTGSIPSELGNLSFLYELCLNMNQLCGSIPAELSNMKILNELNLSGNKLTGSIPSELGSLEKLFYLLLYNNELTGNIPPELGQLSELRILALGYNKLSDIIPSELGNLLNLESLHLDYNQLTGNIPSELGNLSNLQGLNLAGNKLSGDIPTSLLNITNMFSVYLRYNCLSTNDSKLRAWLDTFDLDWEIYQCDEEFPFGSFDTPINGSTVSGSVAVTGWALDNFGIDTIKIYRTQGDTLIYIGDAIKVRGARPDIEKAYPNYYLGNTEAGWGYMMLTHFLPKGGNGTFTLHAIAADIAGNTTTLGTKTIYCDNANAVKPFGAIDTPSQGETLLLNGCVNWGWVLTPMPSSIPIDGSTINVWVDGVNLGHPTYNIYRSDIASLFPGYANSDGAVGYFYLDTTAYNNGVHTIQWTATDSSGNTDGIGSRYFTIQHITPDSKVSSNIDNKQMALTELSDLPLDITQPLLIHKGFKIDKFENVRSDDNDEYTIKIGELEPLRIKLSVDSTIVGSYQLMGNRIGKMPPGMSINNNVINWMPGVAFLGHYKFVILVKDLKGETSKIFFNITIEPKFK